MNRTKTSFYLFFLVSILFKIAIAETVQVIECDPTSSSERLHVSLLGDWEFCPVYDTQPMGSLPQSGWQAIRLDPEGPWRVPTWRRFPIDWQGHDPADVYSAWFRKGIAVPESLEGQRIKIRFMNVHLTAKAYWNGQEVGATLDGFLPFEVDVTDYVKWGQSNELALGVEDYHFSAAMTGAPVVRPIGKMYRLHSGIFGGVYFLALPAVYVKDVTIVTSLREKQLSAQIVLANEQADAVAVDVHAAIYDGDQLILDLGKNRAAVSSHGHVAVEYAKAWENPVLWSPDNPKRYQLVMRVTRDGDVVDERRELFGFREFWIDGTDFVLNGTKIRLKGTWGHTGEYYYARALQDGKKVALSPAELFRLLKTNHLNIVRLHAQVFPEDFLDAADEVGMLIVDETAIMHRPLNDASVTHALGLIGRDKNHPSVVMWSSSNEFEHWRNPRNPEATAFLRHLEEVMRQADPTRPVMAHGYGNLGPGTMIDNIHYPESDNNLYSIPNGLYWPTQIEWASQNYAYRDCFDWQQDKPLVIGEHLIHPAHGVCLARERYFTLDPQSSEAVSLMDAYYTELYRAAVNAYRLQGVAYCSSMCFGPQKLFPNSLFDSLKTTFAPYGVFFVTWPSHYFSEESVLTEIAVYNESSQEDAFELEVGFFQDQTCFDRQTFQAVLTPAAVQRYIHTWKAPSVTARDEFHIVATLRKNQQILAQDRKLLTVFPRVTIAQPATPLMLYDPKGATAAVLTAAGLSFEPLATLELVNSKSGTLLIGCDAVDDSFVGWSEAIADFVNRGGCVICFEQCAFPRWLPVDVQGAIDTGINKTTAAYRRLPNHPLLSDVGQDDLRFWRDDSIVVRDSLFRPEVGNFNIIADCAAAARAAMLELPYGQGVFVLCQLNLTHSYGKEPIAAILLRNLIDYGAAPRIKQAASVVLVSVSEPLEQKLRSLGLKADYRAHFTDVQLQAADILIVDGAFLAQAGDDELRYLYAWTTQGHTLLVHDIGADALEPFHEFLGVRVNFKPFDKKWPMWDIRDASMLGGLTYNDLADLSEMLGEPLVVDDDSAVDLLGRGQLIRLPCGQGTVVVNQIRWEQERVNSESANRLASLLLTSLDIPLHGFEIGNYAGSGWKTIDLTAFANAPLSYEPHDENGQLIEDFGGYDLSDLPEGRQIFHGVPMDLPRRNDDGGRKIVAAMSRFDYQGQITTGIACDTIPENVEGIAVDAYCSELYFLHVYARNHYYKRANSPLLGSYVIHYEDGSLATIPLKREIHFNTTGLQLFDAQRARLAWSHALPNQAVYQFCWRNPRPDILVKSFDFCASGLSSSTPLLIAVTAKEIAIDAASEKNSD